MNKLAPAHTFQAISHAIFQPNNGASKSPNLAFALGIILSISIAATVIGIKVFKWIKDKIGNKTINKTNTLATNKLAVNNKTQTKIQAPLLDAKGLPVQLVPQKIGVIQGKEFPSVDFDKKMTVKDETIENIKTLVDEKTLKLTKKGESYIPLFKHLEFHKGSKSTGDFISPGDVIRTVGRMTHDINFDPIKNAEKNNYFNIHHTPFPNANHYNLNDPTQYKSFMKEMDRVSYEMIKVQLNSGNEHILWNYVAMGAFMRSAEPSITDPVKRDNLRFDTASVVVKALDRAMDELKKSNPAQYKKTKLYVGGPTGASPSFDMSKALEPRRNYNAFVLAFDKHFKHTDHASLCPETDIFIKGQELANSYKNLGPNEIPPVSVINAADPKQLGNRWFEEGANFAIDENYHRRSESIFSFLINGGWDPQGSCQDNINNLQKLSIKPKL